MSSFSSQHPRPLSTVAPYILSVSLNRGHVSYSESLSLTCSYLVSMWRERILSVIHTFFSSLLSINKSLYFITSLSLKNVPLRTHPYQLLSIPYLPYLFTNASMYFNSSLSLKTVPMRTPQHSLIFLIFLSTRPCVFYRSLISCYPFLIFVILLLTHHCIATHPDLVRALQNVPLSIITPLSSLSSLSTHLYLRASTLSTITRPSTFSLRLIP